MHTSIQKLLNLGRKIIKLRKIEEFLSLIRKVETIGILINYLKVFPENIQAQLIQEIVRKAPLITCTSPLWVFLQVLVKITLRL